VLNPRPVLNPTEGDSHVLPLVKIIELKWLLAGEGIHIHAAYARRALDEAAASASPALRAVALSLRSRLSTE
jgi:hypothetical protein